MRHRPDTVGALRRALAGLDDDLPILVLDRSGGYIAGRGIQLEGGARVLADEAPDEWPAGVTGALVVVRSDD